jgi:uncharacterized integral membrane protein
MKLGKNYLITKIMAITYFALIIFFIIICIFPVIDVQYIQGEYTYAPEKTPLFFIIALFVFIRLL